MPEETRGKYAAVIENEYIAFAQQIGEIVEMAMCDRTVGPIHDQQPRMVTRFYGRLSDKLLRQFVVKITCSHEDIIKGRRVICRRILLRHEFIVRSNCVNYDSPMTLPVLVSTSMRLKDGLEPVPGMRLISPETGQMNLAPV